MLAVQDIEGNPGHDDVNWQMLVRLRCRPRLGTSKAQNSPGRAFVSGVRHPWYVLRLNRCDYAAASQFQS